jgi:hypothetical protein
MLHALSAMPILLPSACQSSDYKLLKSNDLLLQQMMVHILKYLSHEFTQPSHNETTNMIHFLKLTQMYVPKNLFLWHIF